MDLDVFPQPVYSLGKHRLQNHFVDAAENPSNCFGKLLCIHE
jgi:hypothetical protein